MGGDPAELMRICVENGTFTVSFLREALSKACDIAVFRRTSRSPSPSVPRLARRSAQDLLGSM